MKVIRKRKRRSKAFGAQGAFLAALIFTAAFTVTYLYGPKPEPPGAAIFERYTSQRMSERSAEFEPLFADVSSEFDVTAYQYEPTDLEPEELYTLFTHVDHLIDGLQFDVLYRKTFNLESFRYQNNPVRTQYREMRFSLLDSISIAEQNEYFKDVEEPTIQVILANPLNTHVAISPVFTRQPNGDVLFEHQISLDRFNQLQWDSRSILFQIPSVFLLGRGAARTAQEPHLIHQAQENPDVLFIEMLDKRAPAEPTYSDGDLDTRIRYRFWLDRSKDYCWVRAEYFQPTPPDSDLTPQDILQIYMPSRWIADAKDYRYINGVWIPHRITIEEWYLQQEILATEDFQVTSVRPISNNNGMRDKILAWLGDYAPYFFGQSDQPPTLVDL